MRDVDPIAAAYIAGVFDGVESDADVPQADDDTFEKFLADRQLAAQCGANGSAIVAGFQKQQASTDARFAGRLDDARFFKSTPALEENPLPLLDDDTDADLLQKAATDPGSRRTVNLREWIKKSLQNGETVESLTSYASGNGYHAMAQEIRKAAAGL